MPWRLAGAAALLSGFGCSSTAVAPSDDFEVEWERPGEGRAAVTALCFSSDGRRLAVGDYRGGVELIERRGAADSPEWTPSADRSGAPESARGEVLLLSTRADAFVAVRRTGEPMGWGRLSGALVHDDGALVGWSLPSRRLRTSIDGNRGVEELAVVAADAVKGRLYLLIGKPPEATRLEVRELATLEQLWTRPLGGAALAVAADPSSGRLVVSTDKGIEILELSDGASLADVDMQATMLQPLRDGRRMVLARGDELAVLDLGDAATPASIGPAFVAHRGGVTAIALSSDGTLLATGGARGDLELFRVRPLADGRKPETIR